MTHKDKTNEKSRSANKINSHEYDYEFGSDVKNFESTTSRYNYEFGNETRNSAKNSPLARGANIAGAFSNPVAESENENTRNYKEEYADENLEYNRQAQPNRMKKRYQENLRQNYNVEFSDDELIDDSCGDCENCPRCNK